ncbi:hypothetical protein PM082_019512 [Marasmius tenuissimus]|nr:hypothetical protein PM082_019512 [Marasmius tenuissimus]
MPGIANFVTPLLLDKLKWRAKCYIHRLPLELIVEILSYLSIEDIMRVRRTNRAFWFITHDPIIWRRFLERLNLPIPPTRPNFRYSLEETDFEVEQLVTRAICADDNWRRPTPKMLHKSVASTFQQVLEMKILPGGRFLIASVKDVESFRFWVCVYCLDHPKGLEHALLARKAVETKPYGLGARFHTDPRGVMQSVMVMYCLRRPADGNFRGLDPAGWTTEIDSNPPYPLEYGCFVIECPLPGLEFLSDPRVDTNSDDFIQLMGMINPPFGREYIWRMVEDKPFDDASLFDINGVCYAVTASRGKVTIVNLMLRSSTTFLLARDGHFPNYKHHIRALRVLPQQNRILVFRTIALVGQLPRETHDVQSIEVFEIPEDDDETYQLESNTYDYRIVQAVDRVYIENKNVSSVHISDYPTIPRSLDLPQLYEGHDNAPLTPISIYVRTSAPLGIVHYEVFPIRDPVTNEWDYVLDSVIPQTVHISDPVETRIIPGTTRSLIYTVPPNDRTGHPKLLSLRRYFNPRYAPDDYKPFALKDHLEVPVLDKERYPKPKLLYSSFDVCDPTFHGVAEKGLSAITWDEGTGRVCVASQEDMKIVILDLGKVNGASDPRFEKWRKGVALLRQSETILIDLTTATTTS